MSGISIPAFLLVFMLIVLSSPDIFLTGILTMATIRKRGNSWQAIVDKNGVYKSKSFPMKLQAETWAKLFEAKVIDSIITGKSISSTDKTLGDLLTEYSLKVSPNKKGAKWETIRISLLRHYKIIVDGIEIEMGFISLDEFDERHVSAFRESRLKDVSGSSVNREWNILSNAFKIAVDEWKWLSHNPFTKVKRPPRNPPRDRLATSDEIVRLIHSSGWNPSKPCTTILSRVMAAWLYSRYTGKRCKEITRLTPNMVHLDKLYVEVSDDSKTGARHVSLFQEARDILKSVLKMKLNPVFGLTERQVDANWRKLTKMAMVEDLTFHDAKHAACTWLASEKKVPIFDLARILGTKDLKTLMIYYNLSASDIVKKYEQ